MNCKNKSIRELLLEKNIIVTDKCYSNYDDGRRLLIDENGNELGYYNSFDALNKFIYNNNQN